MNPEEFEALLEAVRRASSEGELMPGPEILPGGKAEFAALAATAAPGAAADIIWICEGDQSYLFSDRHMTRGFAEAAALGASKDPLRMIAATVRSESATYPRPTRLETFYDRPFCLSFEEITTAVARMRADAQYADIANAGKPVVLIVNNVHGGEYAGKDATLALMRDLTLGELKPLLKKAIVLIVPTINPDGAEVYRRTNEQQFDLNRDYIKLESQEINALVTRVLSKWQPDIFVDTHHGGAAPYTLTFQTCLNPACDQNLVALGNNQIIPRIE